MPQPAAVSDRNYLGWEVTTGEQDVWFGMDSVTSSVFAVNASTVCAA